MNNVVELVINVLLFNIINKLIIKNNSVKFNTIKLTVIYIKSITYLIYRGDEVFSIRSGSAGYAHPHQRCY